MSCALHMPKGYTICNGCGQPVHTCSKVCECGHKMTKGQPCGTSQRVGYGHNKNGGRPHGTTQEAGYSISKSGHMVLLKRQDTALARVATWYYSRGRIQH